MIRRKTSDCFQLAFLFLIAAGLMGLSTSAYAEQGVKVYGYLAVNYEDVAETPDGSNDPGEFSYPHLNLMFQSRIADNFRVYLNFAGDGAEEMSVRNYWGEYTYSDLFKIRAGKIYRPFGLFNEKLDAVPTYLGIEPPELFDKDHLMLPRTGDLMLHGSYFMGGNTLKYSLMTGNKEVIDTGKPVSWDLNYSIGNDLKFGTSGYYSKEPGSPEDVGEGSPPGGVLPWMTEDKYTVLGGYVHTKLSNFTIKAAYWIGNHDAVRDPDQVIALLPAGLNSRQMERFGLDQYNISGDINDIDTDGSYTVSTYYVRVGYTIPKGTVSGFNVEMTPFFFWDYYENEETVGDKDFGGDNEAGVSDDGKFAKPTIGIVFKPIDSVAFKVDASQHMYKWNGNNEAYSEIRFDISYFFR